jgi:alanine racemase
MKIYRCWAEIDLDALRANLGWLRRKVGPKVRIMTVVKADAYGHGLKQIAALLMQSGTDVFGVANLAEASSIRSVGKGWPVLMLGPCLPGEVETAVRDDVMPTLSSLEEARRFSESAIRHHKTVAVHLKVDTGMGRLGCPPKQAFDLAREIQELPGLRLEGLYTHFSSVEDDAAFTRKQQRAFAGVLRKFAAGGCRIPTIHASNSGAVLLEPRSHYGLVRPGLLVYGVVPPGVRTAGLRKQPELQPALTWKCRVGFVKEVPRGTPVSYGHTFTTTGPTHLATLTVGYGDGYARRAGNKAMVLVRGQRCLVAGRVTMDQLMADVSHVPGVTAGDEVVLIGSQGNDRITATELAGWCDTIPWEILTGITHRVPRIYRGGQAA